MKRVRKSSSSAKASDAEGGVFAFGNVPTERSWEERVSGRPDGDFKPYALATTFARDDLMVHPKFGRGVVVLVEGSRVEVLFQEGAKKLGHAGG